VIFWVVPAAIAALALAAHVTVLARSSYLRMQLGSFLGALGAGAALVVPVILLERLLQSWAQIDPVAQTGGQVTLLLYALLVSAPLEMGLVTLAVWPFWRLRRLRMRAGLARVLETKEAVSFAVSAALGFGLARDGFFLAVRSDWVGLAQAVLWLASFLLLCAGWGFALGRNAQLGMGSRRFTSAWLGATIMSAVCDQLAFRRGVGAMVAMIPLVLSMLAIAFVVWRDLRLSDASSSGGKLSSFIASAPAPSLDAIRDAFRREDRPLTLRWIVFGAFVTTGMITTGLVVAVWLGHEVGLDFAAVERQEAGPEAMAPLAALGAGALAAFPGSGYLLARASRARSVLEPAMSSALAMVLMMVFMGLLAPVSVVFAIAFAPVGFALACIGAWIGMGS